MSKEVLEIVNGALDLPDNSVIFKHTTLTELKKVIEKTQKQEKLLELYKELIKVKDEFISIAYFNNQYYDTTRGKEKILEKQIEELENEL